MAEWIPGEVNEGIVEEIFKEFRGNALKDFWRRQYRTADKIIEVILGEIPREIRVEILGETPKRIPDNLKNFGRNLEVCNIGINSSKEKPRETNERILLEIPEKKIEWGIPKEYPGRIHKWNEILKNTWNNAGSKSGRNQWRNLFPPALERIFKFKSERIFMGNLGKINEKIPGGIN